MSMKPSDDTLSFNGADGLPYSVQWGLTPTSVNSAHAPSKGSRDSWVSRESTTGIGCSAKSLIPTLDAYIMGVCNYSQTLSGVQWGLTHNSVNSAPRALPNVCRIHSGSMDVIICYTLTDLLNYYSQLQGNVIRYIDKDSNPEEHAVEKVPDATHPNEHAE
ncbi:hypothetical protein Tco_0672671 [Tanacetum coccineum]